MGDHIIVHMAFKIVDRWGVISVLGRINESCSAHNKVTVPNACLLTVYMFFTDSANKVAVQSFL